MKSRALWLGICLSLSLAAWGQDSASITGTVTDPSGAAVVGAQVTLSSPERGVNRSTTTNNGGDYLCGAVPIGFYSVIGIAGRAKGSCGYRAPGRYDFHGSYS